MSRKGESLVLLVKHDVRAALAEEPGEEEGGIILTIRKRLCIVAP